MKLISKLKKKIRTIKVAIYKRKGLNIGKDCKFVEVPHFGSEPYLITVGNNVLFSSKVYFFTHDGGVKTVKDIKNMSKNTHIFKYGRIRIGDNSLYWTWCYNFAGSRNR